MGLVHCLPPLSKFLDQPLVHMLALSLVFFANTVLRTYSCFFCSQMELKGKISEKQMNDLITSYTQMLGSPQLSAAQQGQLYLQLTQIVVLSTLLYVNRINV